MSFDDVLSDAKALPYREKLKLATKLLQLAAKEEEQLHPDERSGTTAPRGEEDLTKYVADRLYKLRPGKRAGVVNAIVAMFQFQGGISEDDVESLIADLQSEGYLSLDGGRVVYPKASS